MHESEIMQVVECTAVVLQCHSCTSVSAF